MFARIFKSPPFTTSTLNDVFTYLPFSHISPNFDLHYSFVLADVVFSPLNTTAIIPMESIGIPLQQQVRCSHNTDGNTLKTNFVFLALLLLAPLSPPCIYIQPGFPFASFSRFSSLTVCKSSCHFYFFITSQTWQILYSLLKWPVSKMGTAHSTSSAFLSLLSILDNW